MLTHGAGALNDTGLQVARTYHYSLFTVTNAFNNPSRLIYAKPTSITLKAGRVCTPMNGGKTSDLTPLIDWVAFGKGSSYSLRLTSAAGKTILVRYTSLDHHAVSGAEPVAVRRLQPQAGQGPDVHGVRLRVQRPVPGRTVDRPEQVDADLIYGTR